MTKFILWLFGSKKPIGRRIEIIAGVDCLTGNGYKSDVLIDGEKLRVRWPDGTTENIIIKVENRRAYYVTKYHGQTTWVGLLGLIAERV